jgi:hypothetical protein
MGFYLMKGFDLVTDIERTIELYPTLVKIIQEKKVWTGKKLDLRTKVWLEGSLDILDNDGGVIQTFKVKIEYTSEFPFRYPLVTETGGLIPRDEDWHVNVSIGPLQGTLCIAARPIEILQCQNGITTSWFIHQKLIPHLAMQEYKRREDVYPFGEYAHREKGLRQAYIDVCEAKDWDAALGMITLVLNNDVPGRNDLCAFGCATKFKHCHHCSIFSKLRTIGTIRLREDVALIDYDA